VKGPPNSFRENKNENIKYSKKYQLSRVITNTISFLAGLFFPAMGIWEMLCWLGHYSMVVFRGNCSGSILIFINY